MKIKAKFFFTLTIGLTLIAAIGVFCVLMTQSRNSGFFLPVSVLFALVILTGTLVVGMIFFQRNVVKPLAEISNATQRMTDGRLDRPVRINSADEFGSLGEGINDLAINMQEVLLFMWNNSGQNCTLLDRVSGQLTNPVDTQNPMTGIEDDLARIRRNNEDLRDIVMTFSLFEIKLEHEKMIADYQQNPEP